MVTGTLHPASHAQRKEGKRQDEERWQQAQCRLDRQTFERKVCLSAKYG